MEEREKQRQEGEGGRIEEKREKRRKEERKREGGRSKDKREREGE